MSVVYVYPSLNMKNSFPGARCCRHEGNPPSPPSPDSLSATEQNPQSRIRVISCLVSGVWYFHLKGVFIFSCAVVYPIVSCSCCCCCCFWAGWVAWCPLSLEWSACLMHATSASGKRAGMGRMIQCSAVGIVVAGILDGCCCCSCRVEGSKRQEMEIQ